MKICFYGNGIAFTSGNATLVRILGKYLSQEGHEVTVATRSREEAITHLDGIKYVPILVEKKETILSYYINYPLQSILYFFKNNHFDVLHTMASYHSFAILAMIVKYTSRKPMVYSILSPANPRMSYLGFNKLICTSKSIHHSFNSGIYIPSFVDLNEFSNPPSLYDWNDNTSFVVGTIGTPLYRRGVDVLVKAIPIVLNKYPDVLFVLGINLNQTKYEPRLSSGISKIRCLINDLNIPDKNIKIIGEVNIPSFFRSLDIFVYPVQTTKGMVDIPPTILECLAGECALITTSQGAICEVVQNGENGLLINEKDQSDHRVFAETIINLIDQQDLRIRLRQNAKKSVTRYDIRQLLPSFIALYEDTIRG
jgi:glycosyltransferase involved in cell wall biosynthesis